MSFTSGATFPMAFTTAAVCIFSPTSFSVPLPTTLTSPSPLNEPQPHGFLIWGASSSVGTAAVQLASKLGFIVFATASPQHHATIKKLGATAVFNYRDTDVVEKVVSAAKDKGVTIALGIDTITEGTTAQQSAEIIVSSTSSSSSASTSKGKLAILLPWPSQSGTPPSNIDIKSPYAFTLFTADAKIGEWFFHEYLPKGMADGSLVPAPETEVLEGGLERAEEALEMNRRGVSGRKVVVELGREHGHEG